MLRQIQIQIFGWAIKSNAYQLSRGTPLQMVFSSSRNMHSQDKDYNRSLWNDKIRQRSPVSVGTVESRDITNIWQMQSPIC